MSIISVEKAIEKLEQEGVVALPTETVYGLAGRFDSKQAIELIFSTKERPSFDPLILHVSNIEQAKSLMSGWTSAHEALADAFWPGPLTLVGKKSEHVSSVITAGLETVAVRMPNHSDFLKVLEGLKKPLAAPSANRFSKTSPTSAEHVIGEFESKVNVVDGGECERGIESSIVSLSVEGDSVEVLPLRPGLITTEQIVSALESRGFNVSLNTSNNSVSPGSMRIHYQPKLPLVLYDPSKFKPEEVLKNLPSDMKVESFTTLDLGNQPAIAARGLYSKLREASEGKADVLICPWPHSSEPNSEWFAIFDRLKRASSYKLF